MVAYHEEARGWLPQSEDVVCMFGHDEGKAAFV